MARIEVIAATKDQAPVLANLLELYAHDFSQFHRIELGPDGRFGYKDLPLYWTEPGRHPFLIRADGKLAGFVLVKKKSADSSTWDMAEFFVARAYRRQGVGAAAARQVWPRFPGQWEVRVMGMNESAQLFWQRVISEFAGAGVQPVIQLKSGKQWRVFSFESKPIS